MAFRSKSEFKDPHVQKHRRDAAKRPDRLADNLAGILPKIIESLERPVDPRVSLLKDQWKEIVGEQNALHSEPGFIKDFALHVWVDHPGWMPEFQKLKRTILVKVQKVFPGKRPVRKLNFLLEHK